MCLCMFIENLFKVKPNQFRPFWEPFQWRLPLCFCERKITTIINWFCRAECARPTIQLQIQLLLNINYCCFVNNHPNECAPSHPWVLTQKLGWFLCYLWLGKRCEKGCSFKPMLAVDGKVALPHIHTHTYARGGKIFTVINMHTAGEF